MSHLTALSLITRIQTAIEGKPDFTSMAVRQAIKNGYPAMKIIQTIQDQSADNRSAVEGIFGVELVGEIVAFSANLNK